MNVDPLESDEYNEVGMNELPPAITFLDLMKNLKNKMRTEELNMLVDFYVKKATFLLMFRSNPFHI